MSISIVSSPDYVRISERTADALSQLGMGHFSTLVEPERMAFVVLVLREIPDGRIADGDGRLVHVFPAGKWATIQEIERQLGAQAKALASKPEVRDVD